MNVSEKGREFFAREEGRRAVLYDDATGKQIAKAVLARGNATIGIGHLVRRSVTEYDGVALSGGAIDALFNSDIAWVERAIATHVTVPLNQNQYDALASLIFNVGPGARKVRDGIITLKDGRPSTLLRKLNLGDYAGAAAQFLAWQYDDGKPILLSRRQREKRLFEAPIEVEAPPVEAPADTPAESSDE